MPPTSGPNAAPPEPTAAHRPSAILRWCACEKVLRIPARVAGTIIAAPTASSAREAISVSAVGENAAALLSLLLVAFANVGTQGTGSYVNCMIVKSGMPKVSYRLMVLIAMVYVGALTVWGGVEEHFGAFISIAAFIQAPIIGMMHG